MIIDAASLLDRLLNNKRCFQVVCLPERGRDQNCEMHIELLGD